jgi:hypothetical protein
VKLWRKLVEGHPKDSQARIFLAEVVKDGFDDKGEPRAGEEEALAIFQSVLKDEPENSAANLYYIHELERSALHSLQGAGCPIKSHSHLDDARFPAHR